jgi:HD-GYP domain-containing protein (c-di-GMP phosphodiesterase class II)
LYKNVVIPESLKIKNIPGTNVYTYDTVSELLEVTGNLRDPFVIFIYEELFRPYLKPVTQSDFTFIIDYSCDFEQAGNNLFRINGERLSSFNIGVILALAEMNMDLHLRIVDNLQIGISLTVEKDPGNLYSMILTFLRKATGAEAGTLYLMSEDRERIFFVCSQNSLFDSKMIEKKEVPFNKESLVGFVCHTGETLNIPDAYSIPENSPYHFNKDIDKKMNYKTESIITVPMKTNSGEVIGAVQLLNKKRGADLKTEPFSKFDELVLKSLSTLAAVSVENNRLLLETETLLNNMIISSVKAIEQRDPATKGHSLRVSALFVALLKRIGASEKFKDFKATASILKSAETAALLHDFGKVGVREKILMKEERFYPDQLEALKWRLRFIAASATNESNMEDIENIKKFTEMLDDLNKPSPYSDEQKELISSVENLSYTINGIDIPVLNDLEKSYLSIRAGTLNDEERKDMEKHVLYSFELLNSIEWPFDLRNVPCIAASHHEKLDGSGYPHHRDASSLGIVERAMGIVDIYDALTAKDRPYKKAIPPEVALKIIQTEVDKGKLDGEIFELFKEERESIEKEVLEKIKDEKFNNQSKTERNICDSVSYS